ncbi:MAG: site-specific integrase [Candidatus Marinimicrobia bacterium]|nr:site-specific integrase [Candidatus Neomarinimicrobiota bacterium]MCF7828289.1 site-specific integrase [Candidatus Neomarinimicrobiota bacterium]MCF7879536.1 site-specific integrase [Candidatus Neomarinimicrobiota bacterium]
MAKLKFVLREQKQREDGTCPVYLRISHDRKTRFIATDVQVQPSQWNADKQEVRKNHPNDTRYNDHLEREKNKAQDAIIAVKDDHHTQLTAKNIKERITGADLKDAKAYYEKFLNFLKERERHWDYKNYKVVLNKLKAFTDDGPLPFTHIDTDFLRKFETFLKKKPYNNAPNTIYKNLKYLRRVIREAVKEKIIPMEANPFLTYELKKEPVTKDKLSMQQIQKMENLELEPDTWVWHARNFWLFSFYCGGIRFSDVCRLRQENIKEDSDRGKILEYRMGKTGKFKSVKILPQALEILNRYPTTKPEDRLFPLLEKEYPSHWDEQKHIGSKNALVNKYLKTLADKAKIDVNLTFHLARHSYADFVRKRGMDLYSISKTLGHSDLKTTEAYLKSFDEDTVDSALEQAFNGKDTENE